jgi:soluble lytic murein transglycosylase-like protein
VIVRLLQTRIHFVVLVSAAILAVPARAGEDAVLSSGLRLHADRHEQSGELVRLYRGAGVIELPAAMVVGFEADEAAPAPAPQAPPMASPAPDPNPKTPDTKALDPKTLIHAAAQRNGLPAAFVESVAKVESGLDPRAVSPKGALGVMQLMPTTARTLGADPLDVEQNIDAGTRLLRELLLKYGGDVSKALAAYNAGEPAVDRFQGVPPYAETQHYVNTVVRDYIKNR